MSRVGSTMRHPKPCSSKVSKCYAVHYYFLHIINKFPLLLCLLPAASILTEYVLYLWPFLLLVDYLYICILSFDLEIARTDRVCGCELYILGISFVSFICLSSWWWCLCVTNTFIASQLLNSVVITSCCFDRTVGLLGVVKFN